MAGILNLTGLTTITGRERLIAVFGNDYHRYNPTLDRWDGQSIPITTTTRVRSTVFLDKAYFTNGYQVTSADTYQLGDDMKRYDGTNWVNETVTNKTPLANYIRQVGDRLYLANLYFKEAGSYPSKVWFSDLPQNNTIKWGFEEGSITGYSGQKLMTIYDFSKSIYFKLRNIKIGDPIFLTNADRQLYYIAKIIDDFTIELTENLQATYIANTFWAGSNWFDVTANDNNVITGLGENNDRLLVFKQDSLFRFNPPPSATLIKIKGVPGTTSQNSVVNINEYTYYFHRTGIWRTNGTTAELISRPLQDYIDGISVDMYPTVVAWRTGPSQETYRIYVGNVTNVDNNINVDKCTIDFDTITETLSIGNLPYSVTATTEFVESNTRNTYLGTSDGKVYQDNKGNTDDSTAIPFMMDTGFHFPIGPTAEIEFEKVQIHTRHGRGMQVRYKLYGTPWTRDKQWRGSLNDIDNDVTEIKLEGRPEITNIGRGIAFEITGSDINKAPVIERIDIQWKPVTARSL